MKQGLLLLHILIFGLLGAQNGSFSASVSKNPVGVDETFTITFTITNGNMKQFTPPKFTGFQQLSGQQTSQSYSNINGRVTQTKEISYYLKPSAKGTHVIGSARGVIDGKMLKTEPITMQVIDAPNGANSSGNSSNKNQSKKNEANALVYIQPVVSKRNVYEGEKVTVSYKLYVRSDLDVSNIAPSELSYDGFWKQNVDIKDVTFKGEMVNGVRYKVGLLEQVILTAQKPGKHKIVPKERTIRARQGFFRSGTVEVKTSPFTISVKALPVKGKPANFNGAVGVFKMRPEISATELTTDETITFKMNITGRGNLNLISPPELSLPSDFEVHDPEVSGGNRKKVFEYFIVPRRPGEYKLNALSFSFFNPEEEKYITLNTPEYNLKIKKGKNPVITGTGNLNGVSKEDVELLNKDIRDIATNNDLQDGSGGFFGSPFYYTLLFLPLLAVVPVFLLKRHQDAQLGDAEGLRKKGAKKMANKRLAKARKLMGHNSSECYKEVSVAMWGFAADKLHINMADLSKDNVAELMGRQAVPDEVVNRFTQLIDQCEMALYATASGAEGLTATLEEASALMNEIDKHI